MKYVSYVVAKNKI